ncbi:MAG: ABC transporter ATP-binding protein [Firmicutes bacterium]|nr:ABC transporter ATP-binding protein [Bacillota bacterium]
MSEKLLEIKNVKTYFYTSDGQVPAVDGVSFHINRGETVGVVGESGCGKSVTSLSIMGLIPKPPGKIIAGEILFEGEDLLKLPQKQMRKIRGNRISMIFQEPMTSLNPVYTIGVQIAEAVRLHQGASRKEAMDIVVEGLRLVGIPSPERRVDEYPHQLSGGMRQRAMIAMALSCKPTLLIADEPTTALDVTIQAQILELLKELKQDLGMAMMIITHDLGVVAEVAQRVVVMYAGKVVEEAPVRDLFNDPKHPYTKGLLASIPRLHVKQESLHVIEGNVPNPTEFPAGCRFHPRCEFKMPRCETQEPQLKTIAEGRQVRCWLTEMDAAEVKNEH